VTLSVFQKTFLHTKTGISTIVVRISDMKIAGRMAQNAMKIIVNGESYKSFCL
jgi:hypothetical protein